MVKLEKLVKTKLLKSLEKWHATASLLPHNYWEVGDCDICNEEWEERIERLEEWFPNGTWKDDDPPWLFCEEHARELGVIW